MGKCIVCVFILTGCFVSQAAISGYANTFSTANSADGWTSVGSAPSSVLRVPYGRDFNDGDVNAVQTLPYTEGMVITGDGFLNDGVLKLDLLNAIAGDEAMGFTLSGVLESGEKITFSGSMCAGSAYSKFYAQIWDVTGNRLLAETASLQVMGYNDARYQPVDFNVSYTAKTEESGHAVQIRLVENGNKEVRDLYLDNVMVTSGSEPVSATLVTNSVSVKLSKAGLSARCPEAIPPEWLAKERSPRMFCTPKELAAARESYLGSDRIKKYAGERRAECGRFVAMSDEALRALVPPKYCTIVYGLGFNTDPVKGDRLQWCGWDDPFKVKSSDGTVYPNDEWSDDGKGMTDKKTGKKYYFTARAYGFVFTELEQKIIPALADLWALTGDQRCAHACAVLLDAIAAVYPTTPRQPIDYPSGYGRLDRATYMVARGLYNYCTAIDFIASSGELEAASVASHERTIRENLIRNLLWDGGTYCMDWAEKGTQLTNGQADYLRGAGMVGILLNHPHFCQLMLTGTKSLDSMLANNYDRSGQYYETSPSYSKHAADLYFTTAELIEAAKTAGWPGIKSAYENPVMAEVLGEFFNRNEIGGHVPSLGDGGPDMYYNPPMQRKPGITYVHSDRFLENQIGNAWITLVRGNAQTSARAAQLLAATYAGEPIEIPLERWCIFHVGKKLLEKVRAAPADQSIFETGSALYGAKGLAILRGGKGDGRYGVQLFFGPVNNHGQLENLTWTFVDGGAELGYDPGYFNRSYRFGWALQGISHQSIIVNQKSISSETGGGFIRAWNSGGPVQWVLASHPEAYAAEGVTQYERLVAQSDSLDGKSSGYWLDISRVAGGTTRDDSFHTVMTNLELNVELPAPYAPTMFGNLFANSKFLKDYSLSGFEKEKFYWIPPGEGYGFLRNPRAVSMDEPIRLTGSKPGFPEMIKVNCKVIADLLPAEGRKLIIADSHTVGIAPSVPYVIRRDEGEGASLFVKLIRTVPDGTEDKIVSIEAVPVSGQNSLTGAWKVVWKDGTADVWILGDGKPVEIIPAGLQKITTDALVAFVRFTGGTNGPSALYASCSAGGSLSVSGVSLGSSAAVISGTVKKVETVAGKLCITADWKEGTGELNRIKNGTLLVSRPESGGPSVWTVERAESGKLIMQDMNAVVASGILSPAEGKPGFCRITPPVSRFFLPLSHASHRNFSNGKAVYADGTFIGRVEDLQPDAATFRIIKDGKAVALDKTLPVEIRELAEGDRIEIPVNMEWHR